METCISIFAWKIPWTEEPGRLMANSWCHTESYMTEHAHRNSCVYSNELIGVHHGCILSPCLFNFHAEYIMRNAGLEETQAGIKIARRNINSLRYAADNTLMVESKEELKSLLMKVKEESEKAGLKLNIQKNIQSHHFMANRWGNSGNSCGLYFLGL